MVRIGKPARVLALVAVMACGTARAAAVDADTPDYLIPDAPGAVIETQRGADGRLHIEIRGERFDGRALIKRLLADVREGVSPPTAADFDLHIAVATLAGFHGEELRGVDLRLARRAGQIDDLALTGSTPARAAVRASALGDPNARRALYLEADDAGAFLRFVDLYGNLVNGRLWLSLDLPAMQEVGYGIRDFDLADDPALRSLRDALTPPARPQDAGAAPSRVRGQLALSPGKIVVKETSFFNKAAAATLEGIVEADQLDLRGVLAPASLTDPQEPPCGSHPCLRGLSYRVTGPAGAPKLVVNPFIENMWRPLFPR
jgi:hypothetical protein